MAGPAWKQLCLALLRTLPEIAVRAALTMLSAVPQSEISMSGKTVVITGATSGVGLATAILLAERGAEVVMVGRDRTRSNFMRTEIAQYASGSEPILFLADLSSQAEIHRLAEKLHGSLSRIDVLINNAAAVFAEREMTTDGMEKTSPLITLRRSSSLTLCSISSAPRRPEEFSPRPRSSIAENWIFPISRESGDTTGWGPTSARSFATFCLLTNSPGASQDRRLPRTVLVPDPRSHAWVTTCEVYLQQSRGC
jgi:short chain dehydrogenase